MTTSLESRFLLIISGVLLVVVAPLFALFLVLSSEQIAKTQSHHIDALVASNSQTLAKPLWDFDVEAIEQAVETMLSDPLVARVNVRDTSGMLDITRNIAEIEKPASLLQSVRAVTYKSIEGPRQVGWVEVHYKPAGLFSAFDSFNITLSAVFLVAIAMVCVAAVLGNRMMVMRPLKRLAQAIEATRRNRSRHRVNWNSSDEIGQLAKSFNDMQTLLEHEELELKWAHALTTEIYNRTPAMLFSTDNTGRINAVSDYWLLATGYARHDIVGSEFSALLHEDDRPVYERRLAHGDAAAETPQDLTARFRCADGTMLDVLIANTALPATERRPTTCLSVMTDVTDLRQSEQRNRRQAITDHLTGLLNRQGFEMALANAIVEADAAGTELACLFIDLDRFKTINDSLGHAAGDAVLRQFVERLHSTLCSGEISARLGGDEFAVLVSGEAADSKSRELAAKIVALFDPSFVTTRREVRLSASVGLAVYPHQAKTASELLQKSDMAMYTRKRSGKNGANVFDPQMLDDALLRSEIEQDIEQALKNDWFEVYFQPIHNLATRQLEGFEALLRLNHPEKGVLPPLAIIEVAEETGSIGRIGAIVLDKALRQLARISSFEGMTEATIAVNFSAPQFDPGLGARIAASLSQNGIQPHRLVVEITEAVLMEDNPQIRATLDEITRFGCRIALDDFGTGYSSLSYLNRFPVNIVKIDQSFIRSSSDPLTSVADRSRMLIEGITAISHKMHCRVVAEGIETEEQLASLLEADVDLGQGYLFNRPLAPSALEATYGAQEQREAAAV